MPRNMSFMLTTEQIKNRTKTVTRRLGWDFLKPGDILNACEKCMGLKKGEKVNVLCQIEVVSVSWERLGLLSVIPDYGQSEAEKEGFPEMTGREFEEMFCREMRCTPLDTVKRIEFEYID